MCVALCVVTFYMLEICCLMKRRHVPVKRSEPAMYMWVATSNVANVGLEVLYINHIKSHNGSI